jgi:multidrug/hemolysin transport system permease protein
MNHIIALTKRNVKLFLRDKASVFFSLLSTIILVALYFLFVGNLYSDGISGSFPELLNAKQTDFLVFLQMIAGVLIINSLSVSLGAFATIAKDFEKRRTDGLLLTTATKKELMLGYFCGGLVVTIILNLFMWVVGFFLIWVTTGYAVSFGTFLMAIVVLFVASLVSSGIMLLFTVIAKSSAAIGIISGVAGTFFGFLCGIYMPYDTLGNGAKTVGSFLPFTHLTIWFKQTLLNDAYKILGIPTETAEVLTTGDFFSAENIGLGGMNLPLFVMLILSTLFAVGCFVLAWVLPQKKR